MIKAIQKKLLLVEDDVIIGISQTHLLNSCGYSVLCVTTAKQAIKSVETDSEIDLVLMDIDLGEGMDGTEAAKIILDIRDIPLIFLSSHTDKETVEKTEKITSYGYVVKSVSSTVLKASIEMAFRLFEVKQKNSVIEEELRKHQIELEMQNNTFRIRQIELENLQEKYFNAYHYSPIGQLALDEKDTILEANLKFSSILGILRNKLVKRKFSDFIISDDQDKYYLFRKNLESGKNNIYPNFCELQISHSDGNRISVYFLVSELFESSEIYGQPFFRVAIVNITPMN